MKRLTAIILMLLLSAVAFAEWKPPLQPNPQKILNEAEKDTQDQRYEDALAKFVWFHQNALKYDKALYGVRLSFALLYWHRLAEVYPPALVKLKEFRDEAAKNVIDGKDLRESFSDMVSIDGEFGEGSRTKEIFMALDTRDPDSARKVYDLAQPALINAKEYKVCGKYIDPKASFSRYVELYRENKHLAEDPKFGTRLLEYTNKAFTNEVSTLIALLVVNQRKAEAEEIASEARKEWGDASFNSEIDKALQGQVPKPYP
ncbi:MAG: hypothetical protein WC317_04455 [Candidatus Omnitrophota bacterium]|jgi:hypothetical protein